MNELSWMIYLASAAEDLNFATGLIGLVGGVAFCVVMIWSVLARAMGWDDDTKEVLAPKLAGIGKAIGFWWLVAMAVGVVVPGKDTFYAIAASELGEQVIKSETGGKAVEALNAWVDRQIAGKPESAQ